MKIAVLFFLLEITNISTAIETNILCDANGLANTFPCQNINLGSHLLFTDMGGTSANEGSDIWGWTDPVTSNEYAIMGINNGTVFVDVTNATNPIYLGKLAPATSNSIWRDIKTYQNYAYIVSEATGHGMQIIDLTQLRSINTPPVTLTASRYTQFGHAHNIVINESSGFAYATGTDTCSGGLHMMDIQNPSNPIFVGCFSSDGFTHDAQCVKYHGPDSDYTNQEICFNANEDSLTLVDVSDKNNPIQISRTTYINAKYIHQGWLTEDHKYFFQGDELDEQSLGNNTKTIIWDVTNLDAPIIHGEYLGPTLSIDHNLYIKGDYIYMSNYTSGLRIVNILDIVNNNLNEVAHFDSFPSNDAATFSGAWSNYPYFNSGTIILSDINTGLYVLKPTICLKTDTQCFIDLTGVFKSGFEN